MLSLTLTALALVPFMHAPNAYAFAAIAAPSAPGGPCTLLTQSDADAALGKGAAIASTHNPRTGMDECRLKPAHPGKVQEIIVVVLPATGWDSVKKAYVDGKDVKDVRGLGDDAFAGRFIGYNVRKGQKYVKVFGPLTNDPVANDKATRYLAEKAASRL